MYVVAIAGFSSNSPLYYHLPPPSSAAMNVTAENHTDSDSYHVPTSNVNCLPADNWSEPPTDNDYSIMIIGVTGSGKSAACNFFIDKKLFNTKCGLVSVTVKSEAHSGVVCGKKVLFIDTPGFCDAHESEELRLEELGKALWYAHRGIHAIIICFNGNARFDTASEGVLNELQNLGTFWPYSFILYTHADDMGSTESEQKQSVHDSINNPRCPAGLKRLLEQVEYRFMTVESINQSGNHAYHQQKCKELLGFVEHVYKKNNSQLYTNHLFQWAKQQYDDVKLQKLKEEEELKNSHKRVIEVEQELESLKKQGDLEKHSQNQIINSLEGEINSVKQQLKQSDKSSKEKEILLKQLSDAQKAEEEEKRKLQSIIKKQEKKYDQLSKKVTEQQAEYERMQSLMQKQSITEKYLENLSDEIRVMRIEKEDNDRRMMNMEKQLRQAHSKNEQLIHELNETGFLGYIGRKCTVM